jgi:hypothetical protein
VPEVARDERREAGDGADAQSRALARSSSSRHRLRFASQEFLRPREIQAVISACSPEGARRARHLQQRLVGGDSCTDWPERAEEVK